MIDIDKVRSTKHRVYSRWLIGFVLAVAAMPGPMFALLWQANLGPVLIQWTREVD